MKSPKTFWPLFRRCEDALGHRSVAHKDRFGHIKERRGRFGPFRYRGRVEIPPPDTYNLSVNDAQSDEGSSFDGAQYTRTRLTKLSLNILAKHEQHNLPRAVLIEHALVLADKAALLNVPSLDELSRATNALSVATANLTLVAVEAFGVLSELQVLLETKTACSAVEGALRTPLSAKPPLPE